MIWTVFISAIFIAIFLNLSTQGKFWHKHHWYKHLEVEKPSIYSDSKINVSIAYKCSRDGCSAVKIQTYTNKV